MKPVWLTAACLATLLLIACGPQEPIRIGFIGELTGNSADLGEAGRNGAMLAIEQANQSGGINGRPIELLARDTGSTPATAINSAKELLDARVVAVIGTMTSGMTSALLPVHQAAQVVLLSPTATATKLSGVDDQLFRINWTTRDNAQLYARYCLERGYRRLAAAANENNRVFSESWVRNSSWPLKRAAARLSTPSISNRVPTATCRSSRNCCSHSPMRCFSWPMPAIRPASPSKPASWTRNCR